MQDPHYIIREPLLDPKQRVLGYLLSWQGINLDKGITNNDLLALFAFVGRHLNQGDSGWQLAGSQIFLETRPALLGSPFMKLLPPQNVVLIIDSNDVNSPDALASVRLIREQGFGVLLRNGNISETEKDLIPLITHIEVRCGEEDIDKLAKTYAALKHAPSVRMVARGVSDWDEYDACTKLGLDAFVGSLHLTPRANGQSKGMNPSQAMILQLMDKVRKNADIRDLESVLKRDATLSYKLLRYINSAGFGLAVEVTSLRHAVGIIGYSPLYRWLSLLLATASTGEQAVVLMQTAIVRGRFVELLGAGQLPKGEAENLFVTGMFSLLDRLLGIPMEEVLNQIHLPEAVSDALLSRQGMYGPFLELAESCERPYGNAATIADALLFSPRTVNEAHLSALAWSQNFTA